MPVWTWYIPAQGGVWFANDGVYYDGHEFLELALLWIIHPFA